MYKSTISLANKNNSHTVAFEIIDRHASGHSLKILEAGCASGYFGGFLVSCGHIVWGVEPFEAAAEEASNLLTTVYNGTIEKFFKDYPNEQFDAIIFGDVLEHLANPLEVLQIAKAHLSPKGIVVASIPNIAHNAIRAMLIEGRWDYSDLGILDRTHLRFFTKDSLVDVFTDAGYSIEVLDRITLFSEQASELCGLNVSSFSIKAAESSSLDNCGNDFQYVISAKPLKCISTKDHSNQRFKTSYCLRVVCAVTDDRSTLVDIRLRRQLQRWSSLTGGDFQIVDLKHVSRKHIEWGDVFVFQRECDSSTLELMNSLKNNGKRIVFDIDDYLLECPPFLSHHAQYFLDTVEMRTRAIKMADAVSVSTTNLQKELSALNANTFITPNFSESIGVLANHNDQSLTEARLVIASSDRIMIEMLIDPLKILQAETHVKIIAIGPPAEMLTNAGIEVDAQVLRNHLEFKLFVSSLNNAVALIPLDDSKFSSCKSAVKYFDYSVCNIPSICSNVAPYSNVVVNGLTGLLVENDTLAWMDAIRHLLASSDDRQTLAGAARKHVLATHSLDASAHAWARMLAKLEIKFDTPRQSYFFGSPWPFSELEELRATHEGLQASYTEILTNLADSTRHNTELGLQINDLYKSTSWTITSPLRWLSGHAKKFIKG